MGTQYEDFGTGLAKGLGTSLEDYVKRVAEKRKQRMEKQQTLEEAGIKAGMLQPEYDPRTRSIRLVPVTGPTREDIMAGAKAAAQAGTIIPDIDPATGMPTGRWKTRSRVPFPGVEETAPAGVPPSGITAPVPETFRPASFKRTPYGEIEDVTYRAVEPPPDRVSNAITSTQKTLNLLQEAKRKFDENKFRTGLTSRRFAPGFIGNVAMQLRGTAEEGVFKSLMRDLHAQYVHEQTGAQRGMQEVPWLTAVMPEADVDRPDIFEIKLNEAIRRMKENQKMVMDWTREQGYKVPEFGGTGTPSGESTDEMLRRLMGP